MKDPLLDGKINQDSKNKIRLGVNTSFSKKRGAIATKLFKIEKNIPVISTKSSSVQTPEVFSVQYVSVCAYSTLCRAVFFSNKYAQMIRDTFIINRRIITGDHTNYNGIQLPVLECLCMSVK